MFRFFPLSFEIICWTMKGFDIINGNGQVSRFGSWSGQVIHCTRQNMDKFDIFYPEKIYDSKSQTMFLKWTSIDKNQDIDLW